MSSLLKLLREIAGLFFDDGSLAIAVLAILTLTAILVNISSIGAPAAMAFLVGGVTAALLENVLRTARIAESRR